MTKIIRKKAITKSGEYLGKVKDLNYEDKEIQELVVERGFLHDRTYINLDNIAGVDDVVIVKQQPKED